jgi:apolipoprotein N-acyltransferase
MNIGKSSPGRSNIYNWGLPALSGLLMTLSLPPLPLNWLAWIGLLPLFRSLEANSFRGGFRLGYRAGFIYYLGSLYWIILNTGATPVLRLLSLIGVLLILPLIWGISAWLTARIRRFWGPIGWVFAPLIWTAVEVVFSIGEIGFPWAVFALSQSRFLDLIQIAELTGVLFMITWRESRTKPRIAGILLIAAVWIFLPANWGRYRIKCLPASSDNLVVGIVQGNIPAEHKWKKGVDFSLIPYMKLSSELAADSVQLIVWPETAVPTQLAKRWHHRRRLHQFVDSLDVPLITGASDYQLTESGKLQRFNGAFLFNPGTIDLGTYHKIHPVPFGERIPWQRWLPFLGSFRLGQAEFTPGTEYTIFAPKHDRWHTSVLICFESILPGLSRKFVLNGAQFLINITNDGWFGRCSEPYQHLELTRFRAVETRRWVVRAANTGISAVFSPDGRIQKRSKLLHQETLSQTIELRQDSTFFVRHGNWFPICCGTLSLICILALEITRKRDARR